MSELQPMDGPAPDPWIVPPTFEESGRIRTGFKKEGTNRQGKAITFPAKLEQFRLTSLDKEYLERASGLYGGGEPQPWVDGEGRAAWELFTDSDVIDVAVMLTVRWFSQSYEEWHGSLCTRREASPFDGAVLKTRVNMLIPDIGDGGMWRLETGSQTAAGQLAGAAAKLKLAREAGATVVRGRLRLRKETSKVLATDRNGNPVIDPETSQQKVEVRRFVVPTLTPELSTLMDRMIAVGVAHSAQQIAGASGQTPQPESSADGVGEAPQALAGGRSRSASAPTATLSVPGPPRGTDAQAPTQGDRTRTDRSESESSASVAAPNGSDWFMETVNQAFVTVESATEFLAKHPRFSSAMADATTAQERARRLRSLAPSSDLARLAMRVLTQQFGKPKPAPPTTPLLTEVAK